ncbi:TadE/TadG family type IV pilus assembly protein [Aurantimonas sp. 22II-16-19i]|uniref:TadE/TadG family type IV pilus assembly protein n=1 Tax=Aurantimonas sp. 22II-16-19i TaxID=1317114 RepID=UPI0009F7D303|nr:TadE/TadG family type IV pilus assembly protein [Aurantimonas sp. 22II-16-19i]ORE98371.1 TadE family protein [Aurantimonas sp. 22II-16-19i]
MPFLRNRDGAMAVEFALLAFPFFLLMMVLIETSTIFYAELVMDRAVAKVGREVRTGQITTAGLDATEFKQKLCDEVDFLFDCAKLHVDLKTYDSFGLVPTNVPVKDGDLDTTGFGFASPSGEKVTALKAYYKWPLYVDVLRELATQMSDHSFVIVGSAAFMTEPY